MIFHVKLLYQTFCLIQGDINCQSEIYQILICSKVHQLFLTFINKLIFTHLLDLSFIFRFFPFASSNFSTPLTSPYLPFTSSSFFPFFIFPQFLFSSSLHFSFLSLHFSFQPFHFSFLSLHFSFLSLNFSFLSLLFSFLSLHFSFPSLLLT